MRNHVPFGELYAVPSRNGVSVPKGDRTQGTQMINMGELFRFNRIGDADMARVPLSPKELEKSLVAPGDLLFARRSLQLSGAGRCSIAVPAAESRTFESSIIRVRLDPELAAPEFYYYFFSSRAGREVMETIVEQAVVAGIRASDLQRLPVPVPSLPEQRGIAATLGALDDKIESNRRAVDLAEELADALFSDASDSNATICAVAEIVMGSSPPGSSYNEDGDGMPFYQGIRDFGRRYPGYRVWTTAPVRTAEPNDSLLSVRAPVGTLNRARSECCIGRGLAAVRSRFPSTIYYALRAADEVWTPFQTEGTVFGAINRADLSAATIPWPADADRLENALTAVDSKIQSLATEIESLAALRDALLSGLISGHIRVPEAQEAVAGVGA
jgi:type I restriction enzyme S subunit